MSDRDVSLSTDHVKVLGVGLTTASSLLGIKFDTLATSAWLQQLAAFPAPEVQRAFNTWFMHATDRNFTTAAIIREIGRNRFGGISGLWTQACSAVRHPALASGWHYVVFEHPGVHFSIEALGGWDRLREITHTAKAAGFARTEFELGFQDYRPGLRYPAGLGYFNGTNALLIGDQSRALSVYRNGYKSRSECSIEGLDLLHDAPRWKISEPESLPEQLLPEHLSKRPDGTDRASLPWESIEAADDFGQDE